MELKNDIASPLTAPIATLITSSRRSVVLAGRRWSETSGLGHSSPVTSSGHVAPFEEPELFPEELRAFFRALREAATG